MLLVAAVVVFEQQPVLSVWVSLQQVLMGVSWMSGRSVVIGSEADSDVIQPATRR